MQRIIKPKNARSKRALQAREPKLIEDPKTSIFVKSTQTSERVRLALSELHQLRSAENSIQFTKRNVVHPFEDPASLQFWSVKNDASLFLIGSHNKKRPDNLTFVRMFDHQVLDIVEVGIAGAVSLKELKGTKTSPGLVPLMHFVGTMWDTHEKYKQFKSVLLDFFHADQLKSIDLVHGLQHVISISTGQIDQPGACTSLLNAPVLTSLEAQQQSSKLAPVSIIDPGQQTSGIADDQLPLIHFRTYLIQLLKSGQREPRVELFPHGPSFDFKLRRTQFPPEELLKLALKRPAIKKPSDKNKKVKGNKNVDINEMGDKVGKIHVGLQPLDKLQSRKVKALKVDKRSKPGQDGNLHESGEDVNSDDDVGSDDDVSSDDGVEQEDENASDLPGDQDREVEMGAVTELEGSRVASSRKKT